MTESMIQVNADRTLRSLSRLEKSQWPFALAKTLTSMAKLGKHKVEKQTLRQFNIRAKRFTLKGITIRPAKKSDAKMGQGYSEVYTKKGITRYMAQHEKGAMRRPLSPTTETIAVPGKDIPRGYRSAKGGVVRKRWSPKELMKQAGGYAWMYKFESSKGFPKSQRHNKRLKPFTIKTKTGATAIVRRKSRKTRKLDYLWIFKKVVTIDPRWGFEKTVKKTVDLAFEKILKINLDKAVKSAK